MTWVKWKLAVNICTLSFEKLTTGNVCISTLICRISSKKDAGWSEKYRK